jgi:uncharacterized protein
MSGEVRMLHSVVSLDYERPPTLPEREYRQAMREHRLIGHRCPQCGRIYTPPRGYCPVDVIPTSSADEVELPTTGTLVTYTVLNPDALHAQGGASTSRGSVMLDGTSITIAGDLIDISPAEIHVGMRLRGVWGDATDAEMANPGWGVPGIKGWERTGEPDVGRDEVQRLLAEAEAS